MSIVKIEAVSLRDSKAATTSISENADEPDRLADRDAAVVMDAELDQQQVGAATNAPPRPQVSLTPVVRIDSPRGRG